MLTVLPVILDVTDTFESVRKAPNPHPLKCTHTFYYDFERLTHEHEYAKIPGQRLRRCLGLDQAACFICNLVIWPPLWVRDTNQMLLGSC